jgi:hypothetical protein
MNKGKRMKSYQWPCQNNFNQREISIGLSMALRTLSILILLLCSSAVFSVSALAKDQQEFAYEDDERTLSDAELAQTLAPIALYPDTLLTHILIAATYPLEVIDAERWLTKNTALTSSQRQKRVDKKPWDESIKALLSFPRVIGKLSEDLNWMRALGDAFLANESRVLGSIQSLRQQAERAGNLAKMDNMEVIKEQQVIIIEPAQTSIIYVPYYDTRVVYGRWHWVHYPPIYWQSPYQYASTPSHFYWGHGVHISRRFSFSAFHWHNHHVVVNHYNRATRREYYSRKKVVNSHHAKRWNHQPKHRRGVAYSSGRVKQKYYGVNAQAVHNKSAYKNKSLPSHRQYKAVKNTSVSNSDAKEKYYSVKPSSAKHSTQYSVKHKTTKEKQRITPIQRRTSQPKDHQYVRSQQSMRQSTKQFARHRGEANKQHGSKPYRNKQYRDKQYASR